MCQGEHVPYGSCSHVTICQIWRDAIAFSSTVMWFKKRRWRRLTVTFDDLLAQVITLLKRQGRVSYRALKMRFDLDDEYLDTPMTISSAPSSI